MLGVEARLITNQASVVITRDNTINTDLVMKVEKSGFTALAITKGVSEYLKNTETIDPLNYWQFIFTILFSFPFIVEMASMILLSRIFFTPLNSMGAHHTRIIDCRHSIRPTGNRSYGRVAGTWISSFSAV